jgi:hypothetical protein
MQQVQTMGGGGVESDEHAEEEQPGPTYGDAVAGFETVQWYLTSFPTDDTSMQLMTQMEKVLLFMCQTCQTKQTTLLDHFKVTHLGMHACTVFCTLLLQHNVTSCLPIYSIARI